MADVVDKLTQNHIERFLHRERLYGCTMIPTISSGNSQRILVRNPSGSGIKTIILEICCSLVLASTSAAENELKILTRQDNTITATGTAQSTFNRAIGGSDTTKTEIYVNPTLTASGPIQEETTGHNTPVILRNILLKPGDDLTIRGKLNPTGNTLRVNIIFAEEDE